MNGKSETPETAAKDGSDAAGEARVLGADDNGHVDALPLIARFGGIRPMATKLSVPVSTVQGWKERNAIPVNRLEAIKAAARQHDIGLTPEDVVLQIDSEQPQSESEKAAQTKTGKEPAPGDKTKSKILFGAGGAAPQGRLVLVVSLAALVISVLSVLAALFAMVPRDGDLAALETRVAAMEEAFADANGARSEAAAASAALESRIAALETSADEPDGSAAERAALAAQLKSLEQTVAAAGGGADLLALADRVDTTEQTLQENLAALGDRISAVEIMAPLGAASAGDGSGAGQIDLAPLLGRLSALERALAEMAQQPPQVAEDAAIGERLATLERALAEVAQQPPQVAEDADVGARLATLEQAVENFGGVVVVDTDRAIGLTLAAIQLRAALGSGESFEDPYLRARALARGDAGLSEVLAPLEPLALTGVETLDSLRDNFEAAARILTLAATAAEGGWTARMIGRLNSVVSVRRTDAEPGDDGIAARVARTRVRLEAGDLARALEELGPPKLGEDDRAMAWRDGVAARLAVDRAISALESFAYANLAETSTQ